MRFYFGEITIMTSEIEESVKMVFTSEKKGVKGAFKKFAENFYADTRFDFDEDVYKTPDELISHSGVEYREITGADFDVLQKYLPCHEI